jgi:hypothetical protein
VQVALQVEIDQRVGPEVAEAEVSSQDRHRLKFSKSSPMRSASPPQL